MKKQLTKKITIAFVFLVFIIATKAYSQAPSFTLSSSTCETYTFNVTANNGSIAVSGYTWQTLPATALIALPNSSITPISFSSAGLYTVQLSVTNGTTVTLVSNTLNVLSNPSLSISMPIYGPNGPICPPPTGIGLLPLIASGANTYTWAPGGSTSPTLIIHPPVSIVYTVTGTQTNGCVNWDTNYVQVHPLPTVIASGPFAANCSDTIVCLNATGTLLNYAWSGPCGFSSNSQNPCLPVSTGCGGTYTVGGHDIHFCLNETTLSVNLDNTCVWPGDVNSDGTSDNLDILELGLHYASTGGTRLSTSNLWQPFNAPNWAGAITCGKNLHHSDCNGDGIIDQNDTLAIHLNYSLSHPFKQNNSSANNPFFTIVPDQSVVYNGQWGSASIFLGDAVNPINNINGVAYTLMYDKNLIEPDSLWLEYPTSFLNTTNTNLHFKKRDFANGAMYTATTHTNNINISGNGKIATFHYKILSSLTTTTALNIGITQANQSDASGLITPLTVGSASLLAIGNAVGLKQNGNLSNALSVYPNPTSNLINLHFNNQNNNIEVRLINSLGKIIIEKNQISSQKTTVDLSNQPNGIYFLEVTIDGKTERTKVIKE